MRSLTAEMTLRLNSKLLAFGSNAEKGYNFFWIIYIYIFLNQNNNNAFLTFMLTQRNISTMIYHVQNVHHHEHDTMFIFSIKILLPRKRKKKLSKLET